jgi:hypothetical protein
LLLLVLLQQLEVLLAVALVGVVYGPEHLLNTRWVRQQRSPRILLQEGGLIVL